MKLFHAPGSCSLGVRILLEETDADYETEIVDFSKGQQRSREYLALNPKGKVPALLLDDGGLLTEFPAIAIWIAKTFPEAKLLPEGTEGEVRTLELLDYVVATLHMRGATLVMRPDRFCPLPEAAESIRAAGLVVLTEGLGRLEERLGESDYFFGHLTIADAAVFYLLTWQERCGFTIPPKLAAFFDRMGQRPTVTRALA